MFCVVVNEHDTDNNMLYFFKKVVPQICCIIKKCNICSAKRARGIFIPSYLPSDGVSVLATQSKHHILCTTFTYYATSFGGLQILLPSCKVFIPTYGFHILRQCSLFRANVIIESYCTSNSYWDCISISLCHFLRELSKKIDKSEIDE